MSERKLATITTILATSPIEGADRIEVATVRGWQVVVQKGEFQVGDLGVYCECDSMLPLSNPHFAFLSVRAGEDATHFRVKTIKLRKQISQGILFHTNILPTADYYVDQDVTELLGVTQYEPPVSIQLSGEVAGQFPSFFPKTDEERAQNLTNELLMFRDVPLYVTEKLDGTSLSVYRHKDHFGVCSRNWELKETEGNLYWRMARPLRGLIPEGFVVQGEIVGPGVQKNPLGLPDLRLYVFKVISLSEGVVLDYGETDTFCRDLGLTMVPVLYTDFKINGQSVQDLLGHTPAKSKLNPKALCEGHVFRSMAHTPYFSFKLIRPEYLLKHEE